MQNPSPSPLLGLTLATVLSVLSAQEQPSLDELRAAGARSSRYLAKRPGEATRKQLKPSADRLREDLMPILKRHCFGCHGKRKAKADLRIDTLDPDLVKGGDADWWVEVVSVLANGEMPPPKRSRLSVEDRSKAIELLSQEIKLASTARRATGGHSSFRRMTRYEYNYALQDLLGLEREFARDLPPEAHSADGFQNSSETLQMSVTQLETYRTLARRALQRATSIGPRPEVLHWGVTMGQRAEIEWKKQQQELARLRKKFKDEPEKLAKRLENLRTRHRKKPGGTHFKDLRGGRLAGHTWSYIGARYAFKPAPTRPEVPESFDHVAILPPGRRGVLLVELGDKLPDEGLLRVRVLAARASLEEQRLPSLQLEFGWQASNEGRARIRVGGHDHLITAAPDKPEFYEWLIPMGDIYPRNSVRRISRMGAMPSPSEYIRLVNSSAAKGEIQISYVEVSGPIYEEWPTASHRQVFFPSDKRGDEPAYARELLGRFMARAWRRPVTESEIGRKLRLFERMREHCDSFAAAMIEVLATVLSSPEFLYTKRLAAAGAAPETLSDLELASRLATFLWCSVPDETLRGLAERGELGKPEVLARQVQRMLADPRAERLAEHFVHQWLEMEKLDYLKTGKKLPALLKDAMQREPLELFREVLRHNASVLDFIHADYTMANERLARHYDIPGVHGNHFRRVELEAGHRRGGLMTQAGILAMNSSGEDSNPLKRGIWMLESLLNDPPPPPPPAVPEIDLADPRIAKMTLKERLEDHRNHAACMSCHAKIDPWGIAFENYGALGQWRDKIKGKPVDASSRLFNDEALDGMEGLKRFLLKNRQDQFVTALVHKMVVYALGRPLTFADRAGIAEITAKVRQGGDGLATLITHVATSELFHTR